MLLFHWHNGNIVIVNLRCLSGLILALFQGPFGGKVFQKTKNSLWKLWQVWQKGEPGKWLQQVWLSKMLNFLQVWLFLSEGKKTGVRFSKRLAEKKQIQQPLCTSTPRNPASMPPPPPPPPPIMVSLNWSMVLTFLVYFCGQGIKGIKAIRPPSWIICVTEGRGE